MFALLSKRLEEGYARGESGFILDGIPRTLIQAVSVLLLFLFSLQNSHLISTVSEYYYYSFPQETLDQIAQIDLVLNLKCSEEHRSALSETPLPPQEFLGSSILHSSVAIKSRRRQSLSVYAEEEVLLLFFFIFFSSYY